MATNNGSVMNGPTPTMLATLIRHCLHQADASFQLGPLRLDVRVRRWGGVTVRHARGLDCRRNASIAQKLRDTVEAQYKRAAGRSKSQLTGDAVALLGAGQIQFGVRCPHSSVCATMTSMAPRNALLYRQVTRAALLGLAVNLALGAAKLAGGLISGSVALVSDAVNSLGDVFTLTIILVAFRVAQRPPDDEHPYGHTAR